MTDQTPFTPDWVSPPGDTIADLLEEQDLTRAELATRTGFTTKHINELVHGRAPITAQTALKLEAVLGSTASFWLTRECQYRELLARREAEAALEREAAWLKELPVGDMVKFGWVPRHRGKGAQVAACLRHFGVADVSAWNAQYGEPLAAFRSSQKLATTKGAVAAWLRKGELEAGARRCAPWDLAGFRNALPELRALTLEPDPAKFLPRLVDLAARHGVAVAIARAPTGCPASGATRFLSADKALLLLSFRFLADDQFWFSFFHEAGHLLKHGKKALFIEGIGMSSEEEEEANRFARDTLIPPSAAGGLPPLRSADAVRRFAAKHGISPGVVVGRLQFDKVVSHAWLNGLKARFNWAGVAD